MNFLNVTKDGGPESTVWAHWLIELKRWFSVALLRFEDGSRDSYHSHAFNSIAWLLKGELIEQHLAGHTVRHTPSIWPIVVRRDTFHRVTSVGRSWVFNVRGPWAATWQEAHPDGSQTTLKDGREVV